MEVNTNKGTRLELLIKLDNGIGTLIKEKYNLDLYEQKLLDAVLSDVSEVICVIKHSKAETLSNCDSLINYFSSKQIFLTQEVFEDIKKSIVDFCDLASAKIGIIESQVGASEELFNDYIVHRARMLKVLHEMI